MTDLQISALPSDPTYSSGGGSNAATVSAESFTPALDEALRVYESRPTAQDGQRSELRDTSPDSTRTKNTPSNIDARADEMRSRFAGRRAELRDDAGDAENVETVQDNAPRTNAVSSSEQPIVDPSEDDPVIDPTGAAMTQAAATAAQPLVANVSASADEVNDDGSPVAEGIEESSGPMTVGDTIATGSSVASEAELPATAANNPPETAFGMSETSEPTEVPDDMTQRIDADSVEPPSLRLDASPNTESPRDTASAAGVTNTPDVGLTDEAAEQLWAQVARALHRVRQSSDGNEVRLRLRPAELGELLVNVHTNDDGLTVRIVTTNNAATQLLDADAARLRNELRNAGLGDANVDVSHQEGQRSGQQQTMADDRGAHDGRRGRLASRAADGIDAYADGRPRFGSDAAAVRHQRRGATLDVAL